MGFVSLASEVEDYRDEIKRARTVKFKKRFRDVLTISNFGEQSIYRL